jgi:hypothetical protein
VATDAHTRSSWRDVGFPLWLRVCLAPFVAAVVLAGIWVAGGVLTDSFRLSMALTTVWLAAAGLAAVAIAWRWRSLALPVLGTVAVTAAVAGGYLLYTSSVDRVVDEEIVVAAEPVAGLDSESLPTGNVALASGAFTSGAHQTTGEAALIRVESGESVLTLTNLETSPGPDLRVYLVTGSADDFGDVVDLGGLKGNQGNQQYDVPASTDPERHRTVVIWCRAFSVSFGSAALA